MFFGLGPRNGTSDMGEYYPGVWVATWDTHNTVVHNCSVNESRGSEGESRDIVAVIIYKYCRCGSRDGYTEGGKGGGVQCSGLVVAFRKRGLAYSREARPLIG
jgi:hypothetical protein